MAEIAGLTGLTFVLLAVVFAAGYFLVVKQRFSVRRLTHDPTMVLVGLFSFFHAMVALRVLFAVRHRNY
jgi:drug/metabolite transporter (DMT)-like permease